MARNSAHFMESLARRKIETEPFRHLLLAEALPENTRRDILELPINCPPSTRSKTT